MRMGSRSWAVAAIAVAVAGTAHADTYRAVIDRVELEAASIGGARLKVFLSALSEEGALLDLTDPKAIKLLAGSSEVKAGYALGTYAATASDTAIVVIVQATADYSEALPTISDQLEHVLLANIGDRTQVAILPVGESVASGKLVPVKAARGKSTMLASEGGEEPALVETVERALAMLKKAKTEPAGRPLRKMIVIVGDGRDNAKDPERVTRAGKRAGSDGVRIHAMAYSTADKRRSMLTLGELSKRSHGTFRLLRGKESWAPKFEQLRAEIAQQYVVTYFVEPDAVAGKRVKIATSGRATVTSNELKVPALACNGEPCEAGYCAADRCNVPRAPEGRGVFGWIVVLVGVLVGLAVVLGVIGYAMSRKQRPAGPPVPGVPGVPASRPPAKKPSSKPPKHQPVVAAPMPAAPAAPPTSGPRLYILSGPRQGETISLRNGFVIGAAANSDLVIADGFASTLHAQIGMDDRGHCWVYDRGSTNGTFVNGVRVQQQLLDHGTSLRIGSTELRFLVQ